MGKEKTLKLSEDGKCLEWESKYNKKIVLKDVTRIRRMPRKRNEIMLYSADGSDQQIEVPANSPFSVSEWGELFLWICHGSKNVKTSVCLLLDGYEDQDGKYH